jgi:transposase-like protein
MTTSQVIRSYTTPGDTTQMAQGKSLALACKEAELSEQSYYRWRKEYGGVAVEQAKRLKDLERENARLRRLVADLSLEKQILKDVASGNL